MDCPKCSNGVTGRERIYTEQGSVSAVRCPLCGKYWAFELLEEFHMAMSS